MMSRMFSNDGDLYHGDVKGEAASMFINNAYNQSHQRSQRFMATGSTGGGTSDSVSSPSSIEDWATAGHVRNGYHNHHQEAKEPTSGQGRRVKVKVRISTAERNYLGLCEVCGAPATGFHYGVNSCEPCKGFFRRSLVRKEPYICAKNIRCQVGSGRRNPCPLCRFKKCQDVGMSVDAIKIGRYTHEKKKKNEQLTVSSSGDQTPASAPYTAPKVSAFQSTFPSSSDSSGSWSEVTSCVSDELAFLSSIMSSTEHDFTSSVSEEPCHFGHLACVCNRAAEGTLLHRLCAHDSCRPPVFTAYPELQLQGMQNTIKTLLRAQEAAFKNTPNKTVDVFKFTEVFKHAVGDCRKRNPDLEECIAAYESKGTLDSDSLKRMGTWFRYKEVCLRKYISYAKMIPGFRELSMEDQITLVKYAGPEVWVIARSSEFIVETQSYIISDAEDTQIFDLRTIMTASTCEALMKAVREFINLKLTHEQVVIFKALILFFTDRAKVHNEVKVLKLQNYYLEILLYSIGKTHSTDKSMVCKIVSFLNDVQVARKRYRDDNEKWKFFLSKGDITMPPLFKEVFCDDSN